MARRPEVASREKNPAAAGIRRFYPLSKKSKENISALIVVVVVIVVVVARHLPDAVVVVVAEITNSHPSPSPAPSWGSSPRSFPSPSCPRPTESHQLMPSASMGRERRPPDDPGEAEERDRDDPRLPEEGGQAVAEKARGGVVGTAASFVSGVAAFTRRELFFFFLLDKSHILRPEEESTVVPLGRHVYALPSSVQRCS